MVVNDDLTPAFASPFSDAIQKFEDLLAQSGRIFLMGAGCSKCAGLPLTAELTTKVLCSNILDEKSKEILCAIHDLFNEASPPAHIEDYLSELIDWLAITNRREIRKAKDRHITLAGKMYDKSNLIVATEQIKRAIAEVINQRISIETHQRFVEALHRPLRPGKSLPSQAIDYLVLNYDTILEDALAFSRVSFSDGMEGGITGWWNPSTFDRDDLDARIYKLHGSINWHGLPNDHMPRRVAANIELPNLDKHRILIFPASTKYRETQLDPYAQLAERARRVLKPDCGAQKVLVICGYSFGDAHINIEIDRALYSSNGDLTVVVFTHEDEPTGQLQKWHTNQAISDQILIFANRGFFHGDDVQKSTKNLLWWKFENITRILEGER